MKRKMAVALVVMTVLLALSANTARAEEKLFPMVETNETGLHAQPWFHKTFMDLAEDMVEAKSEGKKLVIMWEQKGCPYCREMHQVNLRVPSTVEYIKNNFFVVQLNLWGDREVIDIDGEETTEKKLARKYRVQFTPTIQFFPSDLPEDKKISGRDLEVWRLIGYWKPFHFEHTFHYINEKGYDTEPNFQRWLQARAKKYEAEGKEVKLW